MTSRWNSLYLFCDDAERVVDTLDDALVDLGYERYNPFDAVPGKAYPRSVKMFVAPPQAGWTRVIGTLDVDLLPRLSQLALCLYMTLDGGVCRIETYREGSQVDPVTALSPHLRDGCTPEDFRRALSGDVGAHPAARDDEAIPLSALPDDVQAMASSLNPKHINRMFEKLMNRFGQEAPEDESAARALLAGNAPEWESAGGQQVRAVMDCLAIPQWHSPDFVTLRDAYQLYLRRQRKPDAPLYPGDAEAMEAVPDALDYTPVYGGMMR